ncbi:Uncharacterised protein [Chromobacterium violaceum]|uniref:Uncharacterized protein n=1 Tax=Chromobacterium violaceum TaxID=536 RepID=A0A447THT0_CHRVL|nr:Uncharacterised protein [Chromobacterium violaceum]
MPAQAASSEHNSINGSFFIFLGLERCDSGEVRPSRLGAQAPSAEPARVPASLALAQRGGR